MSIPNYFFNLCNYILPLKKILKDIKLRIGRTTWEFQWNTLLCFTEVNCIQHSHLYAYVHLWLSISYKFDTPDTLFKHWKNSISNYTIEGSNMLRYTVKPVLTTTSEQRPHVNNGLPDPKASQINTSSIGGTSEY
jgi:hypothetical protein